jgi:hypothetical protein
MDPDSKLVLDTLFDLKSDTKNGCFVVNRAGTLLLNSPESILPVIQVILRDTVEPGLAEFQQSTVSAKLANLLDGHSDLAGARVFPGLDYVLGAYLVVGAKTNPDRITKFLATVSTKLLINAISVIPVFFKRMRDGYNFGVAPDGVVLELVITLSQSGQADVKSIAARVLNQLIESK